jgi:hypothetical protein
MRLISGRRGDAVEVVAHHVDAQGAVADQEAPLMAGLGRLDLAGELGEVLGQVLLLLDDQRHPVGRRRAAFRARPTRRNCRTPRW